MATSGLGTASSVMKGVGGMASMIPGYGTAIGAGLSMIGGFMDMADANKQQDEADRLQKEAEKVKKAAPEKEYLQALRGYKMMQQGGMPGYETQKQNIDLGASNALQSIKESSPYGGSVVDAINAVLNKGSQVKAELGVKDAEFKQDARLKTLGMLERMGGYQRDLTKEARERQEALYSQAGDMAAAATANKQIGREKALGAGVAAIGGLAQGIGESGGNQPMMLDGADSSGAGLMSVIDKLKNNPELLAQLQKMLQEQE